MLYMVYILKMPWHVHNRITLNQFIVQSLSVSDKETSTVHMWCDWLFKPTVACHACSMTTLRLTSP